MNDKTEANLKVLKQSVHDYYMAMYKLYTELTVSDTPADFETGKQLSDSLETIRKMIHSADMYLAEAQILSRLPDRIKYSFRARHYVVRRKAEAAGTDLMWAELSMNEGPWNAGNFSALGLCRKQRDRQNELENSDRPNVLGWVKGAYVWEIWSYDPATDAWSRTE